MDSKAEKEHLVTQYQHQEVLETLLRHEETHGKILGFLEKLEERLRKHYEEEHKDFAVVVEAYKSTKWASKALLWIMGMTVGTVSTLAHGWSWITEHFSILPK